MTTIAAFALSLFSLFQNAPADSISLDYCYRQANEHYPTAKNIELQKKITALNVDIANSGYFPQLDVSGRATYQSEVTEFSTPNGGGPPPISKDQYEASAGVTQLIFNGGSVGIRKQLERAKGKQEIYSTKVDLHQIRSQIDQVYFGILLAQQQAKTIDLLLKNIRKQLSTVRSRVENGVLLPSQQHILEAELINAQQDSAETESNVRAGYGVLSELVGENITPQTELSLPQVEVDYQSLQPRRAEYDLFESTRQTLEQQKKLAGTSKLPTLSAFGNAAYGRPGFNFLNDDFHDYYIVGLKVQWNFWDFFNADREMQALQIQQQKVTQNKQAFTRQLNAQLKRISERIALIKDNIERDQEIIKLRDRIVEESSSQLQNGVITATEYITELTRANQSRLSLYINRVQLSQAQTDYITTLGRSIGE